MVIWLCLKAYPRLPPVLGKCSSRQAMSHTLGDFVVNVVLRQDLTF